MAPTILTPLPAIEAATPLVVESVATTVAESNLSAPAAGGGGRLVHLTGAGAEISESGILLGRNGIYATSEATAGHTGMGLTIRTGLMWTEYAPAHVPRQYLGSLLAERVRVQRSGKVRLGARGSRALAARSAHYGGSPVVLRGTM